MRTLIKYILLTLILSSSLLALTDKELAISINLAGKQRMLSQKMTKEAFLIHLDIDKQENLKRLKESSELFNKTLTGLLKGDKSLNLVSIEDAKIQTQLKEVERLWKSFYQEIVSILSGKAKASSYNILEKENMKLLAEMNRAVGLYASKSSGSSKLALATDINLAGKQRMLTQKMAKDLLFMSNNAKKDIYLSDFKKSQKLFSEILDGLFHGNEMLNLAGTKLPNITKQLKVVEDLWRENQLLLEKATKGEELKGAILGLDNIMREMNKGVFIYTQSVNRQKQRQKFASLIGNFMNKGNLIKKRVNLSGRQRMLTQKITKLALLISSNIDKEDNSKKLIEFSDLYAHTLKAFRYGDKKLGCVSANNKEIKEQIDLIEKEWKPFYKHAKLIAKGEDLDGSSLSYIVSKNEQLLKVSNELVKRYESSNKALNYLDKSKLSIINMAGRQRMLIEKMSKEKLLVAKGDSTYYSKLEGTIKLFDESLNKLVNGNETENIAKPTRSEIIKQLSVISDIWNSLKPIYIKEKSITKELDSTIKKSFTLLVEMNKMVKMTELSTEY